MRTTRNTIIRIEKASSKKITEAFSCVNLLVAKISKLFFLPLLFRFELNYLKILYLKVEHNVY